jgi:hypothetical protein
MFYLKSRTEVSDFGAFVATWLNPEPTQMRRLNGV